MKNPCAYLKLVSPRHSALIGPFEFYRRKGMIVQLMPKVRETMIQHALAKWITDNYGHRFPDFGVAFNDDEIWILYDKSKKLSEPHGWSCTFSVSYSDPDLFNKIGNVIDNCHARGSDG